MTTKAGKRSMLIELKKCLWTLHDTIARRIIRLFARGINYDF
jgi:hypothetical protein